MDTIVGSYVQLLENDFICRLLDQGVLNGCFDLIISIGSEAGTWMMNVLRLVLSDSYIFE